MMNLKTKVDLSWVLNTSSLCLTVWDEAVDAIWIEQSVLGPSIRMMRRFQSLESVADEFADVEKMPARVLLCLPRSAVIQRTLDYPASVQADLDTMIGFEASRHVPLAEEERCIAYGSALWPEGNKLSVNLLAARRSDVEAFAARLAGVPVDCVLSFSSVTAPGDDVPTVMVISDVEHVEVALFADGLLRGSQLLSGSSEKEISGAIRRLAAQHRERLGAEGIGRIIFAGPVDFGDELKESICSSFGLSFQTLEIPESLKTAVDEFADNPLPEALCATAAQLPVSMNLIDSAERKVPLSRRTLLVTGLCALLLVELLIGWAVWANAPAAKLKSVNKEIAQIKREAAPVQAVRSQNRELRRNLKQLNELSQTRVSLMGVLKILTDALPDDTYLEGLGYKRGDDIKMKGRSKEPDKLPQLLLDLPFIETIESSKIGEKQNDYHSFNFSAALRSMRDE